MDWTENPLVALFFAFEELINSLISGNSDQEYPIVYTPAYVNSRMSAQASKFMVWGTKPAPLDELIPNELHMIYNPMPRGIRCFGGSRERGILLKIYINAYSKKSLSRSLDMIGVNEKSLFPGLDGIGRYIERKYRFDYQEAWSIFN